MTRGYFLNVELDYLKRVVFLVFCLAAFWNPSLQAEVKTKELDDIFVSKELLLKKENIKKDWEKDLFLGIFSGGFWPSVTRTSSSTVYPSAKVEHSEGYSQSQSGYFGGFYLGYDFKQAALPLCGDKKWKAIPAVAVVFNYGQISTSGFSYESQSLHPSYSNGSNQSFIPEIAAVVNFSNSSPFVPFVGFTLGAALSWLVDPSAINFQGKELLAPDQTAFGSAFTSKFIAD
ncbi:hypothetical protein [Methylacidiphilum caldifontis]|uniref:hypothetical protein n=1 Tax=Methylacidiphilum caldifontis TaxID=2795386 RepID=UPI00106BED4F|nr:hypothetical protein [Methylacidiphilum caldifontis]